jgi:hypothetical protein
MAVISNYYENGHFLSLLFSGGVIHYSITQTNGDIMNDEVGSLIHYIDYTGEQPQHYVGVCLRLNAMKGSYTVLCEGKEVDWLYFMCEVLS